MPDWLKIYNILPYTLRVIAASLHGFRIRTMRYSTDTNRWVAEALARENWTSARWNAWQQERLAQMLWHASRNVPYYRQQWEMRRRNGDQASVESLSNWPVLSKDVLRDHPKAFVADGVNIRKLIVEHTSGTTGKPLTFWMTREAVRQWYALFEARWRGWYGLSRYDRWGIFGGQMVTPFSQQQPPFWVWNAGMNQLYLSSYHISEKNVLAYIEAIRDHRLVYLLGYASSLHSIAHMALEQNLKIPPLKVVLSNAEPLYAHQREVISRAFNCPVHDTYGLSENVCAASECLEGCLHLWPEAGYIEFLKDDADKPAEPGEVGRLVCTSFLNSAMPLIRYEVGDRAVLAYGEMLCGCGRSLPVISKIEGRMDDLIITPDGRRIGRLDPVFKSDLPIREAQIIQETRRQLRLRYVPADGFEEQDVEVLIDRIRDRVGDMQILLEKCDSIPRSANGKFRAVVSQLPGA
jgi:phenylacetate-CoA ligase